MKPLVYVLVLNYCSPDDTLDCIACIRRLQYSNYRLLVIDNASPDGSGARLGRSVDTSEFLQFTTNTGYAGGNNAGIGIALRAGAQYVLIVNPDVRLPPDALQCYVDILEQDKTIGALNSIQVGADGVTIDRKYRMGVLEPIGFDAERIVEGFFPEVVKATTLFGAALMISAKAIRRVGGFDPLYFAYGEETDLCRRMLYHGLSLAVTTKCPVRHLRTVENTSISDTVLFLRVKGFYLCELKDPNRSMLPALKRAMRDLLPAVWGRPRNKFPFTHFPIKPRHAAKTVIWLVCNVFAAWLHREREKRGRCYV